MLGLLTLTSLPADITAPLLSAGWMRDLAHAAFDPVSWLVVTIILAKPMMQALSGPSSPQQAIH